MTQIDAGQVERTIRAKDIYEVLRLAVQGSLAWTLPEAAWQPLARLFGRFDAAMKARRTRRHTARIAATLKLPDDEARRQVTIGAPIVVPKDANGEPDYPAAIRIYAGMLAPYVLRDPGQWRGWRAETSVGME